MIHFRRLLFMTQGDAPPDAWLTAAAQEAPVHGKPRACGPCPLRVGGEWAAGAAAALAEMNPAQRAQMQRWGCHESDRPCAGMLRLVHASEGATC